MNATPLEQQSFNSVGANVPSWHLLQKRREKGLARTGNARVRKGMIQVAWRFLDFQKGSALAKWYRARTENAPRLRKKMIVALARKLLTDRLQSGGAVSERAYRPIATPALVPTSLLFFVVSEKSWTSTVVADDQFTALASGCPASLLPCICRLLMLWTAPPPARKCQGCGCC